MLRDTAASVGFQVLELLLSWSSSCSRTREGHVTLFQDKLATLVHRGTMYEGFAQSRLGQIGMKLGTGYFQA